MRFSRSRRTHLNTSGVMSTHASLLCSFRWLVFCIFIWYSTVVLKCPLMSKSSVLRSGDLGGHATVPQRPIQWPWNCHLTNGAGRCRKYLIRMYGDFESFCSVVDKKGQPLLRTVSANISSRLSYAVDQRFRNIRPRRSEVLKFYRLYYKRTFPKRRIDHR